MFVFSAKMNVFFHNNTVYINTRTPQIILELNNIVLRLYLIVQLVFECIYNTRNFGRSPTKLLKVYKIHKE